MSSLTRVILSQLTPPAQRGNVLARERLDEELSQSLRYPLSIVCAGTGYGKTTSILGFISKLDIPVFWYSISSAERDPKLFLANFFTAFNRGEHKYGQTALRLLLDSDAEGMEAIIALVNALSDGLQTKALLVLDDFQSVEESDEIMKLIDWFINHLPANLHVLIASRIPLSFPSMSRWQAQGSLFEIGRDALSFSVDEVEDLFHKVYQLSLEPQDVLKLHNRTEGWAVALQAVWHNLRSYPEGQLSSVLEDEKPISASYLFDYLAEEVFDKQNSKRQTFLAHCSILKFLDSDTCDFLLDRTDTQDELYELFSEGLFLEQLQPGVYRFHHIFKNFLREQLLKKPGLAKELHRKVASYFIAHEDWQEAISHLLSAEDYPRVMQLLDDVGSKLLSLGLHQSVGYFVGQLPGDLLNDYAFGNYLMGEVQRNEALFELALESYRTAQRIYQKQDNNYGMALALQGQAQVYLDTLRPSNASQLLSRALQLMDAKESPREVAGLLTQIAENQLNQGEPQKAAESLAKARALSPDYQEEQNFIEARTMLRTGRLQDGLDMLNRLEQNSVVMAPSKPQRFHRDTSLLTSLFHVFVGNQKGATTAAQRGLSAAEKSHASLGLRIGKMRLAHAQQLETGRAIQPGYVEEIKQLYEDAMRDMAVARINVEPLWGLCRLLGYSGELGEAMRVAQAAITLATQSGDVWIGMLVRISLGASLAQAGEFDSASNELALAEMMALQVGDQFALMASWIWQAYLADLQGYKNSCRLFLEQALPVIRDRSYEAFLVKPSLLGPNDTVCFVPLLFEARKAGIEPALVEGLLKEEGFEKINYHPGYRLRLSLLGPFECFLGEQKISNEAWKREKARHLLQFLAVSYPKPLSKGQILAMLWPNSGSTTASNALKVVVSALNNALEPNRPSGEQAFFVLRDGDQYTLNPLAGNILDHVQFENLASSDDIDDLNSALMLYKGKLLEGELSQDALIIEMQYFHRLFLDCAEKVLEDLFSKGDFHRTILIANQVIQKDPLFERAYLYQMKAYYALENTSMVRKVYADATEFLSAQLGDAYHAEQLRTFLLRHIQ
ncbi:MAG TPA: BTAD domain-containing putative transcriptional regulator [Anaerolineaceae bacterium]|nr:BTAD domain-containing putative transcriptional regulator [Anaerolineaceae bacterium]